MNLFHDETKEKDARLQATSRVKQSGQGVMDWVSIPRQLRYLASALIGLALAYVILSVVRRRRKLLRVG